MSSEQDRLKHRQRRRNKWAKDLRNPLYRQRVKESGKKKKRYERSIMKRELEIDIE